MTSPQAMNPLPNRPLLNNPSLPLALPNVPSFDQMAYNGRPRKVLPDAGKDFPLLNGIMSGPSSAPAGSGNPITSLERSNPLASGMLHSQLQQPPLAGQHNPQSQHQQNHVPSHQPPPQPQHHEKEKEAEGEGRQLTAIFRPDDAGEWKEKLRQSHEASEQARLERSGQAGMIGGSSWRHDDDDVKEEEGEIEDDEASTASDGDDGKVWKAKRTLRKSVA